MARWIHTSLVLIAVVVFASACSSDGETSDDAVTGIVTEVTGDLTEVTSFVVLDASGDSHLFKPEADLLFYGAPLSHLRDHIVTGQRVTVTFESSAYGEMTAVLIEHADGDTTHIESDHTNHDT